MPNQEQLKSIEDLLQDGKQTEAIERYKDLMESAGESYDLWVNYAAFLFRCGQYEESLAMAKKSLNIQKSAEGFHNLGACYEKLNQLDNSIAAYKLALGINPDFAPSHHDLACVYQRRRDYESAINHYQILTAIAPKDYMHWCNLAYARQLAGRYNEALTALRFAYALNQDHVLEFYADLFNEAQNFECDAQLVAEVMACLEAEHIDNKHLSKISRKLFLYPALFENLTPRDGYFEAITPSKIPDSDDLNWEGLNQYEFISLLANFPIQEDIYEERLTALRQYCLLELEKDNNGTTLWNNAFVFLEALSCQCFNNEFVFYESEHEQKIVETLEKRVIDGKNITLYDIIIYSCYRPLFLLPRAEDLHEKLKGQEAISRMVCIHLSEPLEEKRLKQDIKELTSIDDTVSKLVKEQYEANPYPRWRSVMVGQPMSFKASMQNMFPYLQSERFEYIDGENTEILIAGCGTGKQSIEAAMTYEGSNLTAIDLSTTSIAYAQRKTNELELDNIEYGLADLLKSEELGQKFDSVQCGGVLHHMNDPVEGWKVLDNVLKPGGFMLIALYSEIARQDVIAARKFIAKHGYNSDADSIRGCRQDIRELLKEHPARKITTRGDFYTTSTCRDLIFHVQEHRFSTLQLKDIIEGFGSEFLGFNLPDYRTKKRYTNMFPDDPHGLDLDNWDIYEHNYPDTFRRMYQFWIQKPA